MTNRNLDITLSVLYDRLYPTDILDPTYFRFASFVSYLFTLQPFFRLHSHQRACLSLSLGPTLLASRLVKLFLQTLVHVLDADLQRHVLDAQFLFRLGPAVDVGLGPNLGALTGLADGDVGDLVAREVMDDVD
jgi:hypothetical protein